MLVGMWRLSKVVAVRPDGSTTSSRWGTNPVGYIVYDRSGRMAAQIMGDPRPAFAEPGHPSAAEGLDAFESYLAYAGTYSYDATRHLVTHHVEMSLDPTDLGHDLPRSANFEGDQLVLSAQPYNLRGERVFNRLTWVRVRSP